MQSYIKSMAQSIIVGLMSNWVSGPSHETPAFVDSFQPQIGNGSWAETATSSNCVSKII